MSSWLSDRKCPWTDTLLIRGQWCISFSTAESCRFKEVNWSRMSTWTKVHLRAGPSLGESMTESLRWWLLIGPLTDCSALFFFQPNVYLLSLLSFPLFYLQLLRLQKMTWKSRQADVDTCRMKGKHKVVDLGRHAHSNFVYLSLWDSSANALRCTSFNVTHSLYRCSSVSHMHEQAHQQSQQSLPVE